MSSSWLDKSSEEVVNSIRITEGPVQTMSLAVGKTSRTPYSDATKVGVTGVVWSKAVVVVEVVWV